MGGGVLQQGGSGETRFPESFRPSAGLTLCMSAALRGISCYLKEVSHPWGLLLVEVVGVPPPRVCPQLEQVEQGPGLEERGRILLSLSAARATGCWWARALRPPGCHGRQWLLRPLCQDVSSCPVLSPVLPSPGTAPSPIFLWGLACP